MNLTIFLKVAKVSTCLLSLFILSSCTTIKEDDLTAFPPIPNKVYYTSDPVQSYDKATKMYKVTSEFMENAVLNQLFVDEILKWKRDNGVR